MSFPGGPVDPSAFLATLLVFVSSGAAVPLVSVSSRLLKVFLKHDSSERDNVLYSLHKL